MAKKKGREASAPFALGETLNLAAAAPLAEALLAARGKDLDVSAAAVRHIGAQCGQVLLSATKTWRTDGHELRILDVSPAFDEGVHLMGLGGFFSYGETTL